MIEVTDSTLFFVFLFFILAVGQSKAENGYVVANVTNITCIQGSTIIKQYNISECGDVLNYKTPDDSTIPFLDTNITQVTSNLKQSLNLFTMIPLANATCKTANIKYQCQNAFRYRCMGESAIVDTDNLRASCNDAKTSCSALRPIYGEYFDIMFNCSSITSQTIPLKQHCVSFPKLENEPYSCDSNFQILVAGGKSNSAISAKIVQEQQYLKKANLSDKECEKNVGEVICKMTPACSKDNTKVIAFLRKQKCLEMVSCVNTTKNETLIKWASELCNDFASDTDKPYPLGKVYSKNDVSSTEKPDNGVNKNVLTWNAFFLIAFVASKLSI